MRPQPVALRDRACMDGASLEARASNPGAPIVRRAVGCRDPACLPCPAAGWHGRSAGAVAGHDLDRCRNDRGRSRLGGHRGHDRRRMGWRGLRGRVCRRARYGHDRGRHPATSHETRLVAGPTRLVIPGSKPTRYLPDIAHPSGGSKARFSIAQGRSAERPGDGADTPRDHALSPPTRAIRRRSADQDTVLFVTVCPTRARRA